MQGEFGWGGVKTEGGWSRAPAILVGLYGVSPAACTGTNQNASYVIVYGASYLKLYPMKCLLKAFWDNHLIKQGCLFFLTSWVITDDVGFAIPVPEQQGCIPGSWEDVTIPSYVGLRTSQTGHNIPVAKYYLHQFTWNTANWFF